MRRLAILRPEPGASASLAAARALGLDALSIPLFAVEPLRWDPPPPHGFDGLLVTSANALRHAGDGLISLRALRVYAVGEATAEAARGAGFEVAATGEGGVASLLASLPADLRLLHLCGHDHRSPVGQGQVVTTVPVYCAAELANPDLGALARAVVAVHSPRAARRLESLMADTDRSTIAIAAISPQAAEAAGTGWELVAVAAKPTDRDLLALAARLCDKAPGQ